MIFGAWQTMVLVGTGAAYLGLIRKGEGSAIACLATAGCYFVTGFGSLSLEAEHTTNTEWGIAILLIAGGAIASIAFPVALTKSGPYAEEDEEREDDLADPDSTFLDEMAGRMS